MNDSANSVNSTAFLSSNGQKEEICKSTNSERLPEILLANVEFDIEISRS